MNITNNVSSPTNLWHLIAFYISYFSDFYSIRLIWFGQVFNLSFRFSTDCYQPLGLGTVVISIKITVKCYIFKSDLRQPILQFLAGINGMVKLITFSMTILNKNPFMKEYRSCQNESSSNHSFFLFVFINKAFKNCA